MAGIVIKAGRVIDPSQGIDKVTDVVINRGRIEALARVGKAALANYATVLDASGCVVCPGLIDLHVHLREPGHEHKETIATGSRAAMAGGFTGVACMPNTDPPLDDASRVRRVIEKAEEAGFTVWPIAAASVGRAGKGMVEMAEIVEAGAIAFSDDGAPIYDAHLMRSALEYARMLEVPIVQHAEDTSLTVLGSMHEGRSAATMGVRGMPGIAEDIVVARDILLAEYTGGHVHIAHLSTAASLDMVRKAKKRGVRVTCEVTPHHLTLTDQDVHASGLDPNWKMSPPLRSSRDVRALRRGLKDGTVDFIATDHAPHHIDDKDTTFEDAAFGIVGLETALAIVLTDLVYPGVIDLPAAVALMSTRPAEVFNLPPRTLASGSPANITIFDPSAEWTVEPEGFESKGRNTPWAGRRLQGRSIGVVVEGKAHFRSGT